MTRTPLEIERKFLIDRPSAAWLSAWPNSRMVEITQTYLIAPPGEETRLRQWTAGGTTRWSHTVKRKVSDLTREETERAITQEEYTALLSRADSTKDPLTKQRWQLPYRGQILEIDLYPFWEDCAILEVELDTENSPIFFPPELRIRREVTYDPSYKNSALANRRYPHD